ncbi:MAG TPA: hypothetical protein VHD61_15775 [Lacunisphaera sp.]|nr:hypothetical protein [Lacunisphaera sp.]
MTDVILKKLEEIAEEQHRQGEAQRRVELAVLGDNELGVPGMVKRVGTVEGKLRNIERDHLKRMGMVAGASAVISVVIGLIGWWLK